MCGLLLHVEEIWALWFLCTANQAWKKKIQSSSWSFVSQSSIPCGTLNKSKSSNSNSVYKESDAVWGHILPGVCLALQRLYGVYFGELWVQWIFVFTSHIFKQQQTPIWAREWHECPERSDSSDSHTYYIFFYKITMAFSGTLKKTYDYQNSPNVTRIKSMFPEWSCRNCESKVKFTRINDLQLWGYKVIIFLEYILASL